MSETQSMCDISAPKSVIKPDMRVALVQRRERLAEQLADVNSAIEALEKNPELANLLELLGKASRYI